MMVFEEFQKFHRNASKLLSDDDLAEVQFLLFKQPNSGKIIPRSGGLRKLRVAAKGHGKRGGARVIYYWVADRDRILLLDIYSKNEKLDLSAAELNELRGLVRMYLDEQETF